MSSLARYLVGATLIWLGIAVAQAGQAYAVAVYRGEPQAWWPSVGYAVAIHSIWLLLTVPLVEATRRVEARVRPALARVAAYLAIWPLAATLHIGLFAWLWWPIYNDSGRIATRWAMADTMFVRNFDTNSIYFAAITGITVAAVRWHRRKLIKPVLPPETAQPLVIRSRGAVRRIPLIEIDWIGAAGDYAEVHCHGTSHLIEETLRSLAERLPRRDFARIHRGSVVRIDRITEVRALGRGDASIRLTTGAELRLSRRFRGNLELTACPPGTPARRAG